MAIKSFNWEKAFNGKYINSQVDLFNKTLMNLFRFLEKEAKDLMKILNAKRTSASCNFKTSKMERPVKTDSFCQTLTSSYPPLEISMTI